VQNFNTGSAKFTSKSPLLTLKDKLIRQKVYPGEKAEFVEINGVLPSESISQVILEEKKFAVMSFSFEIEEEENLKDALAKCSFIEVPIKVEGRGVLKIKANFSSGLQESNPKSDGPKDKAESIMMVD